MILVRTVTAQDQALSLRSQVHLATFVVSMLFLDALVLISYPGSSLAYQKFMNTTAITIGRVSTQCFPLQYSICETQLDEPWPKAVVLSLCARERAWLSFPFVRLSGAPLRGSGQGSRRIRYAHGWVKGWDREWSRACIGSLPQPPPFQGCGGELPPCCTTGVCERDTAYCRDGGPLRSMQHHMDIISVWIWSLSVHKAFDKQHRPVTKCNCRE